MSGRLKNKIAFVTGVAKPNGIGWAVARELAREGAVVGITDISEMVREREADLRQEGAEAVSFVTDLRKGDSIKKAAEEMVKRYGRVDILCNVAGMAITGGQEEKLETILNMSEEDWDFSLELNLKTTFNAIKAFLPYMAEKGYGKIVNCSSVTGPLVANPGEAAYCAAKAGIMGLTRALAIEVAKQGITVNSVGPGWITTGSSLEGELAGALNTPIGRGGTPEEVAKVFLFLASDDSRYVTGQLIVVDGGNILQEYKGPSELYY